MMTRSLSVRLLVWPVVITWASIPGMDITTGIIGMDVTRIVDMGSMDTGTADTVGMDTTAAISTGATGVTVDRR